jgi:MoaA/NifB/PqqE/SkfB family radical SAM enzyme
MRCPFCYSATARESCHDLPVATLISFVERNAEWIDSVNYGTGENTLADSWFTLVKHVRRHYPAIRQSLTTNGYLSVALDKRSDADEIMAALDEVDVSLDHSDPTKHNALRGHSCAYQWAVKTIDLCSGYNIPTSIVVMGIDATLERSSIDGIFRLAESAGCFVRINVFRPNSDQGLAPLSYAQLRESLLRLLAERMLVSLSDPLLSALSLGTAVRDASGRSSLRILPDGSITPSTYLVSDLWRRASIADVRLDSCEFRSSLGEGIVDASVPDACKGCLVADSCQGGAIDRRIIWYGDLSVPDPYCPMRHGDSICSWKLGCGVVTTPGPSVHDGYLPTIIFSSSARTGEKAGS